ncbi:hypothetical protein Tco_1261398 [Tanacetum coccineum]
MTSESSARDSSSDSSSGLSRKRCSSSTATVTLPTLASGALVPTYIDLLLPRKRFRDSISPEDSVEEDINADVLADIEADIAAEEATTNMDVKTGIDVGIGNEVDVGVDREYKAESSMRGIVEIEMDRVIEPVVANDIAEPTSKDPDMVSTDGSREVMQLGIDVAMQELLTTCMRFPLIGLQILRSNVRLQGTLMLESARVDRLRFGRLEAFAALAAYEANHAAGLVIESESHNEDDGDNKNGEGNGDRNGEGNGNGNRGGNVNGNPNSNDRGIMHVARECSYHNFMKCQPLNFKGTEGVVGLTRWFKKMEIVFHISNYPKKYQVKYAMCTLLNSALTWWNSHKRTIGVDAAFAMS